MGAGLAFQLNDDLLGIWGEDGGTGKEQSDLAKHKKTLPVIYAWEHATDAERARLAKIYEQVDPSPRQQDKARAILERTGTRKYPRGEARQLRDEALEALEGVPALDGGARDRLREIVVSAMSA